MSAFGGGPDAANFGVLDQIGLIFPARFSLAELVFVALGMRNYEPAEV
jgi:hypothetical protein